jgi:hypothetical protein
MALRRLTKADWRPYCAHISRQLANGERAEVEVVGLNLGDHYEARWVPLLGIAYDPKSDLFEIALEGVDHLIEHPRDVLIETTRRGIVAIEIVDDADVRQIVRLSEPLSGPPHDREPATRNRGRARKD